jgi:hypothetical protein
MSEYSLNFPIINSSFEQNKRILRWATPDNQLPLNSINPIPIVKIKNITTQQRYYITCMTNIVIFII